MEYILPFAFTHERRIRRRSPDACPILVTRYFLAIFFKNFVLNLFTNPKGWLLFQTKSLS